MKEFENYIESLDFFKSISLEENEYLIKNNRSDGKQLPVYLNTFSPENLVLRDELLDENSRATRSIVKKIAIERFHPNNINNKNFWVECRKRFPLLSVCGSECKDINELNQKTLDIPIHLGILKFLNSLLSNNIKKLNFLEIGFGYGNLFLEIKDKCNYYGIDYIVPDILKSYKNLIEIDKSEIPDHFLDMNIFDIVYSVNVLQHCSQQDRFKYLSEGYHALKKGGYFICSSFIRTEENKDQPYWGIIDENDRGYTHFFNQLTECDWDYEFEDHIKCVGYEIVQKIFSRNFYCYLLRK